MLYRLEIIIIIIVIIIIVIVKKRRENTKKQIKTDKNINNEQYYSTCM